MPPRFTTQKEWTLNEGEEIKTEAQKDILAHRGSLSVHRRPLRFFFFFF